MEDFWLSLAGMDDFTPSDPLGESKRAKQSLSVSALSPAPPCIILRSLSGVEDENYCGRPLLFSRTSIPSSFASELVGFALQNTTSTFGQYTVIHKYPLNIPCISIAIQSDLFILKTPRIATSPPSQRSRKPIFFLDFVHLHSWPKSSQTLPKLFRSIVQRQFHSGHSSWNSLAHLGLLPVMLKGPTPLLRLLSL